MKEYVKPAIAMLRMHECLMGALSAHDEVGDGNQLSKENDGWDDEASSSRSNSIWSDDED